MTARPYIKHFEASAFGCLVDVKMELTRLHALIGPNDSGKSTILQAIHRLLGNDDIRRADRRFGAETRLHLRSDGRLNLGYGFLGNQRTWWKDGSPNTRTPVDAGGLTPPASDAENHFVWATGAFIRLDPDLMREPGEIRKGVEQSFLGDGRGQGLAAVYDRIKDKDDEAFSKIVNNVKRLFPTVSRLRFDVVQDGAKVFLPELTDGTKVQAQHMSEGLLYYLGFAAIEYLDPPAVLLVEEPENGLHPSRIADVVRILREISATTQVILATHSPLVVNELNSDEVTVVTRTPEKGTQTLRLADTPHFAERSKVYALGELWLSYANGVNESPLLTKT